MLDIALGFLRNRRQSVLEWQDLNEILTFNMERFNLSDVVHDFELSEVQACLSLQKENGVCQKRLDLLCLLVQIKQLITVSEDSQELAKISRANLVD